MPIKNETFGLIKSLTDVHTMGIRAVAALLRDCGYHVIIAPNNVEYAIERITTESSQRVIIDWIKKNHITSLGFSYRLDPDTGVELMGRLVYFLSSKGYYGKDSSNIRNIFFAGLKPACEKIENIYCGQISTFCGGETAEETLLALGVSLEDIPKSIKEGCQYDKELNKFGEELIQSDAYHNFKAPEHNIYPQYGTFSDSLELRLDNNYKGSFLPITRAHLGPYSNFLSRENMVKEYKEWCYEIGKSGLLDVLSIGTSQLSQSNFGESWVGKPNGGGVPINSEIEYAEIWQAARPMLVRTYSGTKNVRSLAEIYERSINIAWHALSLWWFNELDGRGPNTLYENLKEHLDTIQWISTTGKPLETNVPHHFAFRGADDITYIISGYIAAKTAKKYGIKTFVLQNMLNTPRSTWGIQDLAKGRTLLKLVKELEDSNFRVIFQTRAGLDYFKPDIEIAKVQLASVSALMDDIEPWNIRSPEVIHVVSYSEALFLATPIILNDSIRIMRSALGEYRKRKQIRETPNVMTNEIINRQLKLEVSCRKIINAMEKYIPDLYSPEGLYIAFVAGWLPVPELASDSKEYIHAKNWNTKSMQGSVILCDHDMNVSIESRINKGLQHIPDAQYILKNKYKRKIIF